MHRVKDTAACCVEPLEMLELDETVVGAFSALGHPMRLRIVQLLASAHEAVCVCDLERPLAIKQPTVSHHLRILRESGLVESEQRGNWVYCRLRPDTLSSLAEYLRGLK
jgi:ArsR family transcriptional regulator, arsenate/arsenite/antimonite-responsive transcriptional repressor